MITKDKIEKIAEEIIKEDWHWGKETLMHKDSLKQWLVNFGDVLQSHLTSLEQDKGEEERESVKMISNELERMGATKMIVELIYKSKILARFDLEEENFVSFQLESLKGYVWSGIELNKIGGIQKYMIMFSPTPEQDKGECEHDFQPIVMNHPSGFGVGDKMCTKCNLAIKDSPEKEKRCEYCGLKNPTEEHLSLRMGDNEHLPEHKGTYGNAPEDKVKEIALLEIETRQNVDGSTTTRPPDNLELMDKINEVINILNKKLK
jgi:ssDNA-binding Zn-finger/Zn-ribbon topoisomerase 1